MLLSISLIQQLVDLVTEEKNIKLVNLGKQLLLMKTVVDRVTMLDPPLSTTTGEKHYIAQQMYLKSMMYVCT